MVDAPERRRREKILVTEYDGILPYTEIFYILSIEQAATAAVAAFMRFGDALQAGEDDKAAAYIHEALSHCGSLSRFFWPPGTGSVASSRGAKLRSIFEIGDASSLRDRRLRNALEHFDERLDEFLIANIAGQILPQPMIGSHELADDPIAKIFKLIDPQAEVFVLLNQKFQYAPLAKEAVRVLMLADKMSR